ncbi:MAG: aminoglycoside N(3)-acetyltransferase [Janthinobacterium lividum]
MTEHDLIMVTPVPRTRASLAINMSRLGVASGGVLIVHASLSAIGWVSGGAQAVVEALLDALGPTGTLVMPAHSTQLSDPAGWENPAVPEKWHEEVRASLPAYDPLRTPTRGMGTVAELFRVWPGALRGTHPTLSFAALGPQAERIVVGQPLSDPLGEDGPLGQLHRLGAQVLLLGVGYDSCTALHLAERRAWPDGLQVDEGAPMLVDGQRQWVRWRAPQFDTDLFSPLGHALEASGLVRIGLVGSASCRLMPVASAVDAAVQRWRSSATKAAIG